MTDTMGISEEEAPRGALAAFIARARQADAIGASDLAAIWRMTRVSLRCRGGAMLAREANAGGKIRGAWGRALAESASAEALEHGVCDWSTPCAYDLFFNPKGRLETGREVPKPYVLALDADGPDLLLHLTLFGVAGSWAGEAGDALIRALRRGLDGRGRRRPVQVLDRDVSQAEGAPTPPLAEGGFLEFLTPVQQRAGDDLHITPSSLLTGLVDRIAGLALWHGVGLEVEQSGLREDARAVGAGAEWLDAEAVSWWRASRAQGRRIAMEGVTGVLAVPPASEAVSALLTLGAETHIGGRTALGLGRYLLHRRGDSAKS